MVFAERAGQESVRTDGASSGDQQFDSRWRCAAKHGAVHRRDAADVQRCRISEAHDVNWSIAIMCRIFARR